MMYKKVSTTADISIQDGEKQELNMEYNVCNINAITQVTEQGICFRRPGSNNWIQNFRNYWMSLE